MIGIKTELRENPARVRRVFPKLGRTAAAVERRAAPRVARLMRNTRFFSTLLAATILGSLALLAGCANMPLNRPSALSPAQHSTTEAP